MQEVRKSTRILVIDADQTNFQVRHCIAQALGLLNSIELIHTSDVSEGVNIINTKGTDAIIFSEESITEKKRLLDSLSLDHPPLVLETSDVNHFKQKQNLNQNIMYVPVYDTLEGMHHVLLLAVSLAEKFTTKQHFSELH